MIFTARAKRNAIKLTGERSSSFDLARGRLVLLNGLFMLAYMLVAARAIDLTIIGETLPAEEIAASEMPESAAPLVQTTRADITDRNGVLLATTLKTPTLYADPELISSKKEAAEGLARIFPELTADEFFKKISGKTRFIALHRDITPEEQEAVLQLGEPGLAFRPENRRVYPQGNLAAHLVGYATTDMTGLAGIERSFGKALNGGKALALTLDIRVQHALRRELLRAMKEFSATGAAGIVMDAANGEILAGVSLPDFNPQQTADISESAEFNRLTLGTYELGSVFKIFSTAAFLETHDVPLSATFDAREPLKIGKQTISDYHAENRILTIPEVFMHSSNIGAGMMGQAVGGERLKAFYEKAGLMEQAKFDILETGRPQFPTAWREINTVTAAYGHGIATTPLQVASAMAAIVNGGTIIKPHLVLNEPLNQTGETLVSEKTSHRMRQLLRLVVTEGTGTKAEVPGYSVGGKTGTAEKNFNGRYEKDKLISSFIGAFPIEAPRYVIYIVVDEPKPNKSSYGYATAGWVAAPAFARVVSSMASILGIPPESIPPEQDLASSLKQYVSVKAHE